MSPTMPRGTRNWRGWLFGTDLVALAPRQCAGESLAAIPKSQGLQEWIKPWWLWETIDFWSAFVKHCHFQSSWYHCYTCCCSGLFSTLKRKSGAGADLTLSQLQFWLLSHLHLSSLILHLILDPRFKAIWATSGFAKAPCQVSVRTSVTQGPSLL